MLSEPPDADPHVRWCGGRRGEPGAYPILDPGAWIRTRISRIDGPALYPLSYSGVVLPSVALIDARHKMARVDETGMDNTPSGVNSIACPSIRL